MEADPNSVRDVAIEVAEPSETTPVTAGAATSSSEIHPGDTVTLIIRARIAPGWHIYGLGASSGPNQPTQIELTLPRDIAANGEWECTAPVSQVTSMGLVSVYSSEVTFSQQLKVSALEQRGVDSITCEFHYQACNHVRCLSPGVLKMTVPINLVPQKE